ncbi:MAG TPA: DUF1674 domain-containing protein [Dokdonella sp.]|uniref:DUF1674 domain-containing protein n=1 Tax=Dokdonella sp. TaxID=2291710 RepID=UPI002D7F32CA|nr:DUF1674 domain-containing protein [Dokdonella sp.]HET9034536.1 DUF1674 domain-containing protein [Dokdonella sp.]
MTNSETASVVANKLPVRSEAGEAVADAQAPVEIGGREGLDPVRYGDWEKNGRCIDF